MEEVGAQVASPLFIHGGLSNRFCESPIMARKRSYPSFISQAHHFHHQDQQHQPDPRSNWNSNSWNWDSSAFVAKHVEPGILQLGTAAVEQSRREEGRKGSPEMSKKKSGDEVDENLRLNLGRPIESKPVDETRPNKRVRPGSPSCNYPKCQVDECSEDLSTAKDYHRRHKVCEFHSKSAKALVGKQMQRFCQQCSRFHLLSEFDEGKRSCRRRLAGHNRRRRKTSQADDANSRPVTSSSQENTNSNGNPDIISLLSAFARTQGKNVESGALPDKDEILQILSKINSLALPEDLANKIAAYRNLNGVVSGQAPSDQNQLNCAIPSPSTMDLLTVLSATLTPPNPETLAVVSKQSRAPMEFNSVGGERSSSSYQSPIEDSDCHVQETRTPNLPLQLFSFSPENDSSPPTLASSRKYFSSDSSNPTEERSPSSSPVVQRLFPIQSSASAMNSEISICRETNRNVDSNRTKAVPLELFRDCNRRPEHGPYQSSPYRTGYTSSSGSDHSPSSLSLDSQDRTCRIMFKLFDKDPSHLPGGLRSQIHNWLSNSPMEMESYIRPGCVVLSIYLSMPSATWDQIEEQISERIHALVDSEPDFWGTGRFLIHTGRKLASHDSGKINLCKSWRICSPELISVSPLAVVGGQSTSILLKGRNLISPRTKIHYTNMGGYITKGVTGQNSHKFIHDEIRITGFQVDGLAPVNLGRCFIEVEDGFKGSSFPVIIADSTICNELRVLESELEENDEKRHGYGNQQLNSRQKILHFLNELGWLFQGLNCSPTEEQHDSNHIIRRYKFLFTFAVERDWCCLVKKLLDILIGTHFEGTGLSRGALEELSEVQLLNRAVRRRCRKMVDLLIHYETRGFSDESSKEYIFPPNLAGPGGVTPLHLAASTSGSEDIVDALTNDPQQIGLNCWSTLLDATGQSPHAYAAMRNNHSYNHLVDQKLADRKNGQVSLRMTTISNEIVQEMSHPTQHVPCTQCASISAKYGVRRRIPGRQGVLHRPYIHSMLVIGAVCVCVCLFLRGAPKVGLVAPFKWENLDFGAI